MSSPDPSNKGPAGPVRTFCMRLYDRLVLSHARVAALVLLVIFAGFAAGIRHFRIDASADSLVLENDADLRYYREILDRYGNEEYLVLVYQPQADLFSAGSLAALAALHDDLERLPSVASVVSMLSVPLLRNPPVPLTELGSNVKTLESPDVDLELARREFEESPLFRDMLVSPDLRTTALQISLKPDATFDALLKQRTEWRDAERAGGLTPDDRQELARIEAEYAQRRDAASVRRHEDINAIRAVMDRHRTSGQLFLGGVPMIADDMVAFIKKDLRVFGAGMVAFLVLTLVTIFRRVTWVLLPASCCLFSVVVMMGGLGWFGWNVTVISSNFISLQLIITMALSIHLIVRYRELQVLHPDAEHRARVQQTVHSMFRPCLYTSLTTMVGFSSLIYCDILPVINFGWMMTLGLGVSLLVTFLLLPSLLVLLRPPTAPKADERHTSVTDRLARFTRRRPTVIFSVAGVLILAIVMGVSRLEVENSFIDYFQKDTEIYRGMIVVDEELGGTTPLNVILKFPSVEAASGERSPVEAAVDDANDPFAEFGEFDEVQDTETYWYTANRMDRIAAVHRYLESLPAVGKVVSLDTTVQVAGLLKGSQNWDSFELAVLFSDFPDEFRRVAVDPYVAIDRDEARVSVRIKDSLKSLRRDALLKQIRRDLEDQLEIPPDRFRVAGMMVLYNNMLQSLFRSQVQTIGFTILGIMLMFIVLFRSVKVSLIAMVPNMIASFSVLGVMGLMGLPLDMMTITIVAISIGIAVDNTIHYIHRFKHELAYDGDYEQAMFRCHGSIGKALYYTTITIVVGFSILVFSEFKPSNYFGLLTGLAILIALLAALTLLPRLILLFKPFGVVRRGHDAR